jgi:hypothetical protein
MKSIINLFRGTKNSSKLDMTKSSDMAEQIILKLKQLIHVSNKEELHEVLTHFDEEGIRIYNSEVSNIQHYEDKQHFEKYTSDGYTFFIIVCSIGSTDVLFGHPSKKSKTASEEKRELGENRKHTFDMSNCEALEASELFTTIIFSVYNKVSHKLEAEIHSIREFRQFYNDNVSRIGDFYVKTAEEEVELDSANDSDFYLDIFGF